MKKFKSILLVDDDDATNYLHRLFLQEWDCAEHIYTAPNGQEALEFLQTNRDFQEGQPSLILLDINMPIMNGFEFMEAYQTLDSQFKASIVVVMLTSSLHHTDQERASGLTELASFINKPLSQEQMHAIMEQVKVTIDT
ncbi:MAG: response regulator [Bacteroidota bacterium]